MSLFQEIKRHQNSGGRSGESGSALSFNEFLAQRRQSQATKIQTKVDLLTAEVGLSEAKIRKREAEVADKESALATKEKLAELKARKKGKPAADPEQEPSGDSKAVQVTKNFGSAVGRGAKSLFSRWFGKGDKGETASGSGTTVFTAEQLMAEEAEWSKANARSPRPQEDD